MSDCDNRIESDQRRNTCRLSCLNGRRETLPRLRSYLDSQLSHELCR